MDITITLQAELGMKAKEAAARQGWDLEEYVISAVELALEKKSLDEILEPVRRQFAESGMTEEELTSLVKEERRAMWNEKHGETTE